MAAVASSCLFTMQMQYSYNASQNEIILFVFGG